MEAGLTMNGLVRWMIGRGLAGLEAWAGTPGTVGGAIHGNAHYGGRDISEHLITVALVTPDGEWREEPAAAMGFGYDTSRLFETREIVVWADVKASAGEPDALRAVAAYRSDADTVPLTDSIGTLPVPVKPVSGLETANNAGVNVLVDDYWDLYQALLQ